MEDIDSHSHKKLLILIIGLIAIVLLSTVYAVDNGKTTKKVEPLKQMVTQQTKYSPKSVLMNSTDIYVFGVLPTRNTKKWGHKRYNVHIKNEFKGQKGVLSFRYVKNTKNYRKNICSLEGLVYVSKKGWKWYHMDFSIVDSYSHDHRCEKIKIVSRSVYKNGDEKRYKKIFKIK